MTQEVPNDARSWPIGFRPEPLEFVASPELNQQYAYAQEDFATMYLGPEAVVHPALLLNMSNTTRSPSHKLEETAGNIHARDECEFVGLGRVGDRLRVDWVVEDRYEKRGRPYRVTLATVTDSSGTPLLRRMIHVTWTESANRT
jgi:hypothetical protein